MKQTQPDNLVVRQHERVRCSLAAKCAVAEELSTSLALAAGVADASGQFAATLTDVSRGGVGPKTGVFMPKNARLTVKLTAGGREHTMSVRVMRVVMTDRTPQYELGTSFTERAAGEGPAFEALIKAAGSAADA